MYAFLKTNWLSIVLVLAVISFGGLWARSGIQYTRTRTELDTARDRIGELETSLVKAGESLKIFGRELDLLRGDYSELESEHSKLEEAYRSLREGIGDITNGNSELQKSNETSLGLVRSSLEIIEKLKNN